MADDSASIDHIAFLARSKARVELLEELLERESVERHECREAVDASRSTVSRTLDALEERGWVACDGRQYELTATGSVVAESFLDLVDTVGTAEELAAFLRHFPIEEFDLELAALGDAEVVVSTEGDPYAPATRQNDLMLAASRFRGLFPSIEIEGSRMLRERVVADDIDSEFVVSPAVAETITRGEYARLYRDMIEAGGQRVFAADESLPFYLGLVDDEEVHVGVEDEEGYPRALLVSTAPSVRDWAEDCYESHRDAAERLELDAFES